MKVKTKKTRLNSSNIPCHKILKELSKEHKIDNLTVEERVINDQLVSLVCNVKTKHKKPLIITYSSNNKKKAIEGAIRVLSKHLNKY